MRTLTFGEIRRDVETKMHKRLGVSISVEQLDKVRELSPKVAEGKLNFEAAILEVEAI